MIDAVINHLWQSTVFALGAALLTLAFRRNGAKVRFFIWLAASVKFLIPLSLFVGVGEYFRWETAPVFAADPTVTQSQALIKAHKYEDAVALLDKAHTANPKSTEITKALVDAHLASADSTMADDALPPMRKYPSALREYRKVLALDKTNQKAKANVDQIEGIYKQMGRPIPQ